MIKLQNISFAYGEKQVLKDFSLEIKNGDRICLFGESGCGKTTLLRLILGLENLKKGKITIKKGLKPSIVFQENRMLPFKSVIDNITLFGADKETALENLKALGIPETADLKPEELSGGMERRAAIARALSQDFDYLLLDEPFTGLDQATLKITAKHILKVAKDKPIILITHSLEEAKLLKASIINM